VSLQTEVRLARALHRRRARKREDLFLCEGVRVVEELLRAGIAPRFALVGAGLDSDERGRSLRAALERTAPVRRVSASELASAAATESPQGVVAVAPIPESTLTAAERRLARRASCLVLDAVQDPGNFGALARTAAAFGVDLLVALPGTVDPWNPKAVRASAGMVFRLPVVACAWDELEGWLRRLGFAVYGSEASGTDVAPFRPAERWALIAGNEGAGVEPPLRRSVDAVLSVPIRPDVESLNVAVATGILLFALAGARTEGA
jgi:RNA methyltransferase, TrmH family